MLPFLGAAFLAAATGEAIQGRVRSTRFGGVVVHGTCSPAGAGASSSSSAAASSSACASSAAASSLAASSGSGSGSGAFFGAARFLGRNCLGLGSGSGSLGLGGGFGSFFLFRFASASAHRAKQTVSQNASGSDPEIMMVGGEGTCQLGVRRLLFLLLRGRRW